MKQRILLIVAMLLIAAPAFAAVTVTVTQGTGTDVNKLTVSYTTGGEKVRAFALDLTLGSAGNSMTFAGVNDINDFNRGESNKPGGGYGIFPGRFRNNIDPGNPNWFAQYYTPVAPENDVDSNGTGFGNRKIIAELGTLYKDTNNPGTSGILFTIRVDANSKTSDTLAVAQNSIRGGVVLEDGSAASTNLPTSQPIALVTCPAGPPATLTYPAADANNGRYQVSWSSVTDATGYKLDRSPDGGSSWTTNIYVGASTSTCDDVNTGSYKYRVCATKGGCTDTSYTTGAGTCAVVLCFPTSEPNMTTWKNLGKPRCWCYQRQCRGDLSGSVEGGSKGGYYWVGSADIGVFSKAYLVKEPTFGVGLKGEPNICADVTHTVEGGSKGGYYRVGSADIGIFSKTYLIKEPTFGSGIGTCPAGASGSRFTLPTDNKPCN